KSRLWVTRSRSASSWRSSDCCCPIAAMPTTMATATRSGPQERSRCAMRWCPGRRTAAAGAGRACGTAGEPGTATGAAEGVDGRRLWRGSRGDDGTAPSGRLRRVHGLVRLADELVGRHTPTGRGHDDADAGVDVGEGGADDDRGPDGSQDLVPERATGVGV